MNAATGRKPEWPPHECNRLCGKGWHVERLTAPDDMNRTAVRDMLMDDWDAIDMRLEPLREVEGDRVELLVWWRPRDGRRETNAI